MPTVWFIRHAESEANAGLRTARPDTIQLTGKGLAQSEQIARSFLEQPDLTITSPFLRAQQTAQATLLRYPDMPYEIWPVHEFSFLSSPRWEFSTKGERWPMVMAFWQRQDPHYIDGEGAESFADFMWRVRETVQRLRTRKERFIVIFSHDQFIRAVAWHLLLGLDENVSERMDSFYGFLKSFTMPNGSIWKMDLGDQDEPRLSPLVTAHLLAVPSPVLKEVAPSAPRRCLPPFLS